MYTTVNVSDFKKNKKSQVYLQTKNTRHKVQLPLHHIYFEISQFNHTNTNNHYRCYKICINYPFSVASSLVGKWMRFAEKKIVQFVIKSHR